MMEKTAREKTAREWKEYYSTKTFEEECCAKDTRLGMQCGKEGTIFRLWSPVSEWVKICFYRDGHTGNAYEIHQMQKQEKGVWEYCTKEYLHGVYYDFLLCIEGKEVRSADPYAKACGVNGIRSMAVDLKQTNPTGWESDKAPEKEREQLIYELHVKEFSWDACGGFPEKVRGTYKAFTCENTTLRGEGKIPTGLSHIKQLGVNYVQLMPVYDYGSVDEAGKKDGFNWGYDPLNYNVPEGSYSSDPFHGEVRILELKEAIQSLHRQGFRVIMDVVYNHTYSIDSWFQKTVPWYFYRVWEDGTISNGSACGNDVASEQPMCAKYILESVLYWAEEYHIDGFRFDLMGLLDVDLMNRIRKELDVRYGKGEKLVFGEPWRAGKTAMERQAIPADKDHMRVLDENIGMFSDDTRDAIKGSVFEADESGFVNGAEEKETEILHAVRAWCDDETLGIKSPSQIISYVSAHDNHTLWDKLSETTKSKKQREKEYRLAAGIYLTCQGVLFFLSGEEFARTKGGRDNTYNAPIEINRLDWKQAEKKQGLVDYYCGMIALRKRLSGLCDKGKGAKDRIQTLWNEPKFVGVLIDNKEETGKSETIKEWDKLCIVYNSQKTERQIKLAEGVWEILADGEDSFLWQHPKEIQNTAKVAPTSILILGQRAQKGKKLL